jgi:hypothetical protein
VSGRTLDEIQTLLSASDRDLLLHVQALRLVTGAQLRRIMTTPTSAESESAARTARRTLQRLGEWRVLDRLPSRAAGGSRGGSDSYTWHVGPVGLRLLDRMGFTGKRLGTPSDRYVRHTLGVSELVTRLIEADRAGVCELLTWEAEPACWRPFLGYGASRGILKPDLAVQIGAGSLYQTTYLIEYDCATEGPAALATKLKRHLAYRASGTEIAARGIDPKVVWLVPDAKRGRALRILIGRMPQRDQQLFEVTTHDDAIEFFAREATS